MKRTIKGVSAISRNKSKLSKLLYEIERLIERIKIHKEINSSKSIYEIESGEKTLLSRLEKCLVLIKSEKHPENIIDEYKKILQKSKDILEYRIFQQPRQSHQSHQSLSSEQWEESSVEGLDEISDLIVIDRSENICSLSRDISRINEMFNVLQSIISSQGETIDNIEKNIQTSLVHTERGQELLVDAEKSQWVGFRIKLITGAVMVFGAIGTIIGLIK